MGKRRKTSQSEEVNTTEAIFTRSLVLFFFFKLSPPLFSQEEASRGVGDDRPSVPAVLSEKKMDSSNVGNNNKVKVMANQLLAKFEENAPAPQTGLKRQVGESRVGTRREDPSMFSSLADGSKRALM